MGSRCWVVHRLARSGLPVLGALGFDAVSTRKLIVLALLCGLAILVAFTIQVLLAT